MYNMRCTIIKQITEAEVVNDIENRIIKKVPGYDLTIAQILKDLFSSNTNNSINTHLRNMCINYSLCFININIL